MKIRLHVQDGPKGYDFEHPGPSVAVGRNPAGDLVLEEDASESVVSWDHARIDLSPREATLTDLRSTNGTYRNGTPVSGTVPLWPQDSVRFGQTGPVLTVRVIDLAPAADPLPRTKTVPPPVPVAVAAPAVKVKPAKAGKAAAAPVMSETRGIALQAVKEMMAQQEELREQQEAHARQRRALAAVAVGALLLFLILLGGLLVYTGKIDVLGRQQQQMVEDINDTKKGVDDIGKKVQDVVQQTVDQFAKIDQQLAEQRENLAKIGEAAQQTIEREAAKLRGGMDQLKKDFGASLDDLNRRLTDKPAGNAAEKPAGGGAVAAARGAAGNGNARKDGPRVEPGMKMDVVMKRNGVYYTGVLLCISGTEVTLQTNANAGAKPSKFDIKDVQAFQTRDGIFALNESTGEFEPALTYFRFDRSSGTFAKMADNPGDTYMAQDVEVLGATNSAKALLAFGKGGEMCLGLPIPESQAPGAIPAYHIKKIITSKVVYNYDESKQDYTYKPLTEYAAEAKAARDEFTRQYYEKEWAKRKESYQLVTERVRALAPLYWRHWWWW